MTPDNNLPPDGQTPPPEESIDLQQVKQMVDLPDTASDIELITVLVNIIANLQEKYEGLLQDAVAMEDHVTNRDIVDYKDVIDDGSLPFWKEQILVNRTAALSALEAIRTRNHATTESTESPIIPQIQTTPLRNRLSSIPRTVTSVAEQTHDATSPDPMAFKIRNRAHEIVRNEKVPFIIAFQRAEQEIGAK